MYIDLYETHIVHEKSLYNLFDLLGDVGGLLDLFILVFSLLLSRYNESLFLFNQIQSLHTTP